MKIKGFNDKEQKCYDVLCDGTPHTIAELKKKFAPAAKKHCEETYEKGSWDDAVVDAHAQSFVRNSLRRLIRDGWIEKKAYGTYQLTRKGKKWVADGVDKTASADVKRGRKPMTDEEKEKAAKKRDAAAKAAKEKKAAKNAKDRARRAAKKKAKAAGARAAKDMKDDGAKPTKKKAAAPKTKAATKSKTSPKTKAKSSGNGKAEVQKKAKEARARAAKQAAVKKAQQSIAEDSASA